MFKKLLANIFFGSLLFLLGTASPVLADQSNSLSGSFSALNQTVNFEASAPSNGGSLNGNFTGACTGTIDGIYDSTAHNLNGSVNGQCSILGFTQPFILNYSGSVDPINKTLTISNVTHIDGSSSQAATLLGLPQSVTVDVTTTEDNLTTGTTYTNPQNSQVKVIFNTLPANPGSLSFSEAIPSTSQIDSFNIVSDKAYKIVSSMTDGTFIYNLTLPLPAGVDPNLLIVRFGDSLDNLTGIISNITINSDDTITISNLDHFTYFVVSIEVPVPVVNTPVTINETNKTTYSVSGTATPNTFVNAVFTDTGVGTLYASDLVGSDGLFSILVDLSNFIEGLININIWADDNLGHNSLSQTFNITKDTIIPTLISISSSTSNSNGSYAKIGDLVTIYFTSSESIDATQLFVTIAGNSVIATNAGGNNWLASYVMSSGDTEGAVSYTVSFIDSASNNGTASGNTGITFDKTAPSLPTITTNTINLANITNVTLTGTGEADALINYTISDSASNNVSGIGIVASDGTINISGIDLSSLNQGDLLITLTLTDEAGNVSVNGLYPATKDTIAPNTTDNVDTNWHNGTVTITLTCSDLVSGCQKIVYTTDGSDPLISPTAVMILGNTATITLSAEGVYTIKYYSDDVFGNQGSVVTSVNQVQIDLTNPTSSAGSDQTRNALFTQIGTGSDTLSGIATVVWSMVSGPGVVTFGSANNLVTTISADVDGNYVISLTVTDNAGNSFTSTFSLVWDTIAPSTIDNTDSNWHTSPVTITLTCSDNLTGCANTYYTTDGSDPTLASSIGNSILLATDGIYTIKYFSVDNAGNVSMVLTALNQVKLDQTAPTAVWIDPVAGSARNRTINLSYTSSDNLSGVANTATFYKLNDGVDTFHSMTSNWDTSPLELGNYTLRIVITDVAGNSANIDEVIDIIAIISNFKAEAIGTDKVLITFDTNHPTRARVRWNGGASGEDESFVTHHVMTINELKAYTDYLFEAMARIPTGPYSISDEKAGAHTYSEAGNGAAVSSPVVVISPVVIKPEVTKQAAKTSIFEIPVAFAAEENIPTVEGESVQPSTEPSSNKPGNKNSDIPLVNLIKNIFKIFGSLFASLMGIFN